MWLVFRPRLKAQNPKMSPYKDFRSENKDLIKTAVVIRFFLENCTTKTTLNFTQSVIDDILSIYVI